MKLVERGARLTKGHAMRLALSLAMELLVGGCSSEDRPPHPGWVIHSKVVFLTADLAQARPAPAQSQFRVTFPYVTGDLYGAPAIGELSPVPLGADGSFEIDLNRTEKLLSRSLEPTEFSLSYLSIQPAQARIGRLAPMVLQADGIDPLGRVDWVDPDSRRRLLLIYVDRPAHIAGETLARGHLLRYDIRVGAPGYVWVARQAAADADTFVVVPKPQHLELAVTPMD